MNIINSFSGLTTKDLASAKEFYSNVIGLTLTSEEMGLKYSLPGGSSLFIYEKVDHSPANYTALNLVVDDIDTAVEGLKQKGVQFESYDWGENGKTDDNNVMRGKSENMGPDIAWFKDPAGNFISLIEQ